MYTEDKINLKMIKLWQIFRHISSIHQSRIVNNLPACSYFKNIGDQREIYQTFMQLVILQRYFDISYSVIRVAPDPCADP